MIHAVVDESMSSDEVLSRLSSLRQHSRGGKRSPHKPLLVLLALGRLTTTGTSALSWAADAGKLADLIRDFGPASTTQPAQAAAYPFTRLRSDGIWTLDRDVPMDRVQPLTTQAVSGRLAPGLERALLDPDLAAAAARRLVESEFPPTVAPDVLAAVGMDPDTVLGTAGVPVTRRQRQSSWPATILQAWDRQCAFCGFDGQLGAATVGVEAAHIRWFAFDGPDTPDNGLALCSLHHKLFDHGVLGLNHDLRITVSAKFTSRTTTGRAVYELHERPLDPRPGTTPPAADHISWHTREVFKSPALSA
ncbi:putative restriction endonuclease [Lentzea fradiae]|uniref:Putative restriction endonuclease n=1 Tax=Lentzea fradiae TaxID=200378 RepID=A0A1G8BFU1_9PSEU|nr:HNH endonuclease [Lentzea fradiae]SDH31991.1 putative restriction endonuclease [Lentzea fradiae]